MLECKAAFVCMGKAMMIMAATISLAAIFLWFVLDTDADTDLIPRIEIGVVSMDSSDEMETLTTYLQSMPVLKLLGKLHFMEQQEALQKLSDGELKMVVMIPQHFLQDAVYMKPSTLTVCIPKNGTGETQRMLSLLTGVERVMLTTESAIRSMYEGMQYDAYEMSVAEMERSLTGLYLDRFMNRDGYFREEYLSAYGGFTPAEYYGVSVVLLLTVLFSICFFALFAPETVRLEKLLNPGKGGMLGITLMKICCMGAALTLWIWLVLFSVQAVFEVLQIPGFYVSFVSLLTGLMIGMSAAAILELFISVFGNGIRQQIAFGVLIVLVWLCGGTLGSAYYLPRFLRPLTKCNIAFIWVNGMLKSLFTQPDVSSILPPLAVMLICLPAAVYGYMKCLQRSR